MEITLIRHGEPAWDVDGRFDADPELTARGHSQAEQVAAYLEAHPLDALWVSNARRARQTAAPLARRAGVEPHIHPWLHEISSAGVHNLPSHEVQALFAKVHDQPVSSWWEGADGCESGRAFVQRVCAGLDATMATLGAHSFEEDGVRLWHGLADHHITIVSHGGTTDVVIAHLLGLPHVPWPWKRFGLLHTGIARLTSHGLAGATSFGLGSFQVVDHLDPAHITA